MMPLLYDPANYDRLFTGITVGDKKVFNAACCDAAAPHYDLNTVWAPKTHPGPTLWVPLCARRSSKTTMPNAEHRSEPARRTPQCR